MNDAALIKRLAGVVLLAFVFAATPALSQSSDNANYAKGHITSADGGGRFPAHLPRLPHAGRQGRPRRRQLPRPGGQS